ncbi:MAG: cyclic nucleotide-binding domain-containing protein [Thermoanaerobaculia bacterium]
MNTLDKLATIRALSHLEPGQREMLAACCWPQTIPEGAALYRDGDPAREAFALVSGGIDLVRKTAAGPFAFGIVECGDVFGEEGSFGQTARAGEALATETSEVLAFDSDRLRTVGAGDHRFRTAMLWAFWKSLAHKLRGSNERLRSFFAQEKGGRQPEPAEVSPGRPDPTVDLATRRSIFVEQSLSAMEVNFLASLSRHQHHDPGELIFREGDSGDTLYVVLDGEVMISKRIPGAGEEALAFLRRGEYFGEMALIDDQPRSASATAHSGGATVLAIAEEVVEGLLHIDHVSSSKLLEILCGLICSRLVESDDKLVGWHILAASATPGATTSLSS